MLWKKIYDLAIKWQIQINIELQRMMYLGTCPAPAPQFFWYWNGFVGNMTLYIFSDSK